MIDMDNKTREKAEAHAAFLGGLSFNITRAVSAISRNESRAADLMSDFVHDIVTTVWVHAVKHEQERVAALEKGEPETCDAGVGGEGELREKICWNIRHAIESSQMRSPGEYPAMFEADRILALVNQQPLCCPDCGRVFRRGSAE